MSLFKKNTLPINTTQTVSTGLNVPLANTISPHYVSGTATTGTVNMTSGYTTTGPTTMTVNYPWSSMTTAGGYAGGATAASIPTALITLYKKDGSKLLEVTPMGEVVWDGEMDLNEGAEAFSKIVNLGVEVKAGLTQKVKCNIRDAIFNEIIEIAKIKGSLTVEELTLILESTKIMEKLKG
jgi:hypothetical protein